MISAGSASSTVPTQNARDQLTPVDDALPDSVETSAGAAGLPIPKSTAPDTPSTRRAPQRKKLIAAVLISLAIILTVSIGYWLKVHNARTATTGAPLRVAVLPFRNLKQDPETDFLSFSLADAIITKLGYVDTLIVRPSAYVDKYRSQVIDPAQVAADLKVDLLLTGTFIKEGDDLRITAQLVDVGRNQIVRQDAMDLKYDKLLTVQDRVTAQVISGLKLDLSPSE